MNAAEKILALETDYSWFQLIKEYSGFDDQTFADCIACFFADRLPKDFPFPLPDWFVQFEGLTLEKKRQQVISSHGWYDYSITIFGLLHLTLMAWEDYKYPLHVRFIEAMENVARNVPQPRILDFGCGTSSFGQLAMTYYDATCTLADVDPESLSFLQMVCDKKWPNRVSTLALPILGTPVSKRSRVRIDYRAMVGPYDVIVAADTLEHTLDALDILIYLSDQLNEGGFLLINYPDGIEGDWHTPEANYLRPWCLRYLRRATRTNDELIWWNTRNGNKYLKKVMLKLAPLLTKRARRFARQYFRRNGALLIQQVAEKARRSITVNQLIASVDN